MTLDLVVGDGGVERLDRALASLAPGLSRRQARVLIAEGAVFVDGRRCRVASRQVVPGARLRIHLSASVASAAQPTILFEDARIVVVDKPAGIHVNETDTTARVPLSARLGRPCFVVHRLDRDTTGVIVLAKSTQVAAELSAAFRERRVHKDYVAFAEGRPVPGMIDDPIGYDRRRPRARRVRRDGQDARTEVTAVIPRGAFCEVHLRLHTGRTHQIRVHLAHRGHPVLGDTLYGGGSAVHTARGPIRIRRSLLHAHRLGLPGWTTFEAPLPADMVGIRDS